MVRLTARPDDRCRRQRLGRSKQTDQNRRRRQFVGAIVVVRVLAIALGRRWLTVLGQGCDPLIDPRGAGQPFRFGPRRTVAASRGVQIDQFAANRRSIAATLGKICLRSAGESRDRARRRSQSRRAAAASSDNRTATPRVTGRRQHAYRREPECGPRRRQLDILLGRLGREAAKVLAVGDLQLHGAAPDDRQSHGKESQHPPQPAARADVGSSSAWSVRVAPVEMGLRVEHDHP